MILLSNHLFFGPLDYRIPLSFLLLKPKQLAKIAFSLCHACYLAFLFVSPWSFFGKPIYLFSFFKVLFYFREIGINCTRKLKVLVVNAEGVLSSLFGGSGGHGACCEHLLQSNEEIASLRFIFISNISLRFVNCK